MYIKDDVLHIEKEYFDSVAVLARQTPKTIKVVEKYTKEQIEEELEETRNFLPVFDSEEYDAGDDSYFYKLEYRDERIEELEKMLSMFN